MPEDVPHRTRVIEKCAQHLRLIAAANEHMNLTRISTPQEAAIKHVFDSVAPWRYFEKARLVLDAGTGAGFPGIPLALALPEISFILSESVQKKARFVESSVESLGIANVEVLSERAETLAMVRQPDIITARAVAPVDRLIDLFGRSLDRGARLLLLKGPDVENELSIADQRHFVADILGRYDLPDGLGSRTMVSVSSVQGRGRRSAS